METQQEPHKKLILPEYRMSSWCRRQIAHKNKNSQTPGKLKGIKATYLQRYMCVRNRSWKDRQYESIMSTLGKRVKS